jgi:hypothetical protein
MEIANKLAGFTMSKLIISGWRWGKEKDLMKKDKEKFLKAV